MMDFGEKIAVWAVNVICSHPAFVGWFIAAFAFATLVNFGIKTTWAYADMPRWARFILGFTMPMALNFYWLGKKVGIQEPTVPSSSVRDAEKQP